jgi:large subunit ribosomal protein L17
MRHLKRTAKLGRTGEHRNAMLANLVCSLIKHKRVTTTVAKAKAARSVAEKMVTFGKGGTLHDRRLAAARLRQQPRTLHRRKADRIKWRQNEDVVRILFEELAPAFKERRGGYTRIVRVNQRQGDAAQLAILEWVDFTPPAPAAKPVGDAAKKAPKSTEIADKPAETGEGSADKPESKAP